MADEQPRDERGRFVRAGEGFDPSKFLGAIVAWRNKAIGSANALVRQVAREGYSELIRRSPVDKGQFRGNWRVGVNQPDLTFDRNDKSDGAAGSDPTSADLAKVDGVIVNAKVGDIIHITNATPYATVLEDGWSGQAPSGMIALTADDLRASIGVAIRQVRQRADAGEFAGGRS